MSVCVRVCLCLCWLMTSLISVIIGGLENISFARRTSSV